MSLSFAFLLQVRRHFDGFSALDAVANRILPPELLRWCSF
jgi:hypothetical protein